MRRSDRSACFAATIAADDNTGFGVDKATRLTPVAGRAAAAATMVHCGNDI
jgi:hypothetical protein